MKFASTETYVAAEDLIVAVNAAVTLERPLLVKGEPGTGKTELARQVAAALGLPLMEWHVKSTTKAQQGLYEYDAVSRLRDSQLGEARVHDVATTSARASCGRPSRPDPGGAADRRDRQGRHRVSQRPFAGTRPDGVPRLRDRRDGAGPPPPGGHHHLEQRKGTARRLPAPLLLSTTSAFPMPRRWPPSCACISPASRNALLAAALTQFFELRETPGLKKKPSTSEALDWLKLILAEDLGPRI
jgi:hypothetical protein